MAGSQGRGYTAKDDVVRNETSIFSDVGRSLRRRFSQGRRHTSFGEPRWPLRVAIYAILIVGAVVTIYPFWFLIVGAFKSQSELFSMPPTLWPETISADNFQRMAQETSFYTWLVNSVIVLVVRVLSGLFLCSLAGFAFAKYRFPFRRALFGAVLVAIVVPLEAIYVPLFVVMSRIEWVNTLQAVIVPWMAWPLGIFLMRQYIRTIPDEIIDAARVDGASGFRIYRSIIVPLSKPAFAALGIVLFLSSWTQFFWPLVVLTRSDVFTIPVGLSTLLAITAMEQNWEVAMPAALITAVPLILMVLFFQRHFVAGLTGGWE